MADRIIRNLPKQVEVAKALNETPQVICHRIHKVYPKEIADLLILLDLAGYEVKEK